MGYRENVTKKDFLNDDIDKTWNIEVSKQEGQDIYQGKIEYCPATGENPLYIPCLRTDEQSYLHKTVKIDAGEHGKKAEKCNTSTK